MFTDYDSYLFHEGTDYELYKKLGAHICEKDGVRGVSFAVWAPNARAVRLRVSIDGNGWRGVEMNEERSYTVDMERGAGGVWETFVKWAGKWTVYRYEVLGADGTLRKKADPVASFSQKRPSALSIVWDGSEYVWGDGAYMETVDAGQAASRPMSIYEVHLGSWKKDYRENPDGFVGYRRLADELADYVNYMGFTHVELIGICEHPFDGSWGYQVTGFYSPTSRYGNPDDFRYFVDKMHRCGIGVILDWVPAHFPKDPFGLENFDGTALFESPDPLLAEYPEWGTKAFDHSKPEVRSFLISNACYWLNEFHIDALRVDAVAAMFYTSFGRAQWRPNKYGGNENLDSIAFLKQLSVAIEDGTKGYLIAEDSSIMQGVTTPVREGGIGFMFKWNMGWMNDTLKYFETDPVFRGWHHDALTHTADYAFTERFVLVLSHDEVVHLKKSLFGKMQGSIQDKFGALKTLYAYQFAHPGKKLIFMAQEFAETGEWSEARQIDWGFAEDPGHRDVMEEIRALNAVYRKYPTLHDDVSVDPVTFEWVNRYDAVRSTISFIRRNPWNYDGAILAICNFTPVRIDGYNCGAPVPGLYKRVFSTYDSLPSENPKSNGTVPLEAAEMACDGYNYAIRYDLRPYETVYFELPGGQIPG